MLDYSGDLHETGKNIGDDLNEGKPTLPLIHVMRRGTPAQIATVRRAIEDGGRDAFAAVLDAIHASGALEVARTQARAEAAAACDALAAAGDSAYKQGLLHLAAFAVERNY